MARDAPAATAAGTAPGLRAADTRAPLGRVAAQYAESRIAMLALVTLVVVAAIAVTAPLISPQNPYDLRAIDIEDGRLPPGASKLSKQAETAMAVSLGPGSTGDWQVLDVKPRGRSGDAPADALALRLSAAPGDTAGRFSMTIAAVPGGPLDPLRAVQVRGLPRGSELSSGAKDRFRNVWKLTAEDLDDLAVTLPASASGEVRLALTATGGAQRHLMTYWLGTDDQGRDMLSAIFYGLRISLGVALVSVLIALSFGTLVGLYAAYHGGRADAIIMRVVDLQLSFPTILVALILLAILGKGIFNVVLALGSCSGALRPHRSRRRAGRAAQGVRGVRRLPRTPAGAHHRVSHPAQLHAVAHRDRDAGGRARDFAGGDAQLSRPRLPVTQPSLGLLISNGFDYLLSGYPWISVTPGVALLITVVPSIWSATSCATSSTPGCSGEGRVRGAVSTDLLRIEGLRTEFATRAGVVRAVDGIDLSLRRGEILGLVGESGSGKSVTGFSIIG